MGQASDLQPSDKAELEAAKKFQAVAQRVASEYELRLGDGSRDKCARVSEPVLRWSNPLGGRRAHGEIFLWTRDRLPVAVLSINEFTRVNGTIDGEHEWSSLANGPILATGPHLWSPQTAGISFAPLAAEQPPADSPTQRLRQMRALATRFSGTKTTRAGQNRELRLMPQPLYRYDSTDAQGVDGGLFALVEATDPEALLRIEARRSKSGDAWQYAFARLNSVKLSASFDGRRVWESPALTGEEVYDRIDKPYSAFIVK